MIFIRLVTIVRVSAGLDIGQVQPAPSDYPRYQSLVLPQFLYIDPLQPPYWLVMHIHRKYYPPMGMPHALGPGSGVYLHQLCIINCFLNEIYRPFVQWVSG